MLGRYAGSAGAAQREMDFRLDQAGRNAMRQPNRGVAIRVVARAGSQEASPSLRRGIGAPGRALPRSRSRPDGGRLVLMPAAGDDLARSSILDISSYDLGLDLTYGPEKFWSRTEVRFRCRQAGAGTFADLDAVNIRRATLNGTGLDPAGGGRLELPRLKSENVLVVEAEFAYTTAAEGLHYVTDAADGSAFVYGKCSGGGGSRIYCCFDRPDLRAAFTVSVNAPAGWSCLANAPVISRPPEGDPGTWRFAPTAPIPPWLSSFSAGLLSTGAGASRGPDLNRERELPVTIRAVPSAAALLEPLHIPELLRHQLHFYQTNLGVPYPYEKCDLIFGPISPDLLAYSVTSLIIIQDEVLKESQKAGSALYLATVIAHELAHTWFGGLVTMPREQRWLDEALTTYISRTALAEIIPDSTPWAASTSATLPDDNYARDAAAIRQLEGIIGRPAVINGLGTMLRRHAHGQTAKDDLVRYWSQASGHNLRAWAAKTLVES
jgi:aminopeptidase N